MARFYVQGICGLLAFVLTVMLYRRLRPSHISDSYRALCKGVGNVENSVFSYAKWERFLRINGASYHFWKGIHPVSFLLLSIGLFVVGTILGASFGILQSLFAGALMASLPCIYLEYVGKKDNEEMLSELDMIYSALAIQVRAGVHVVDALTECYLSVKNERLRDSLQVLSGDIVMKGDLTYCLRRFQADFDNRYIDTLCITLLQAVESGQSAALLGDISDRIKDMQIVLQGKKKEKLNRSVTFYQLGIFALILVLTLYACVTHLLSASVFFT